MMLSTVNQRVRILNAKCGCFSEAITSEIEKFKKVTHVEAVRDYLLQNAENYGVRLVTLRNINEEAFIEELISRKVISASADILEIIH
jgi:hypothetical protein